MTTVGYGDISPQVLHPLETIWSMTNMVIGVSLYSIAFGGMSAHMQEARKSASSRCHCVLSQARGFVAQFHGSMSTFLNKKTPRNSLIV